MDTKQQKGEVRLHKALADAGLYSRRQAEILISEGCVTVNAQTATIGQKITPGEDKVCVKGKSVTLTVQERVVLAMNKPRNVVCSRVAYPGERSVFELVPAAYSRLRLFCVGRLDKESEGLLLLTNDGDLAYKLSHPSHEVVKKYQALLNKPFDVDHIAVLKKGVYDDGEKLFADAVIPQKLGPKSEARVEIHLKQGRKREIRRMLKQLGYFVKRLKRIQIGHFALKQIPLGGVVKLTPADIEKLT